MSLTRLSEAGPEAFAELLDELMDDGEYEETETDRIMAAGRTSIHSSMTEEAPEPPTWRSALAAIGVDADDFTDEDRRP